jgi:hypothetical protein
MSNTRNGLPVGDKYMRGRSTTDTAAMMRAEIKAAVKAGKLPQGKYSIRSKYYSGGSSIDVRISDVPVVVVNRERVARDLAQPHVCHDRVLPLWSAAGLALLAAVEAIYWAYGYDHSDSQTDHFDVAFYGQVDFDWRWTDRQRKAIEAQVQA